MRRWLALENLSFLFHLVFFSLNNTEQPAKCITLFKEYISLIGKKYRRYSLSYAQCMFVLSKQIARFSRRFTERNSGKENEIEKYQTNSRGRRYRQTHRVKQRDDREREREKVMENILDKNSVFTAEQHECHLILHKWAQYGDYGLGILQI